MSKSFLPLSAAFALAIVVPASAALYNVDFVRNDSTPTFSGAGVWGSGGQFWNRSNVGSGWVSNAISTITGLRDANGVQSTFNFGLNPGGDHNGQSIRSNYMPGGSGASWASLFDRSISHGGLDIIFSGFSAGQLVNLVIYQAYDVQNSPSYTVNGVSRSFTWAPASSSMVEGRDYHVVMNVAADANGRIVIEPTTGTDSNSGISALQIEVVPAPGAIALLGFAGLLSGRRRR